MSKTPLTAQSAPSTAANKSASANDGAAAKPTANAAGKQATAQNAASAVKPGVCLNYVPSLPYLLIVIDVTTRSQPAIGQALQLDRADNSNRLLPRLFQPVRAATLPTLAILPVCHETTLKADRLARLPQAMLLQIPQQIMVESHLPLRNRLKAKQSLSSSVSVRMPFCVMRT